MGTEREEAPPMERHQMQQPGATPARTLPQGAAETAVSRRPRADRGLPRRKALLLSRAASARFSRVAKALPGGEAELAAILEPWIDQLFNGDFVTAADGAGRGARLENMVLTAVAAKMKGAADGE